MSNLESILKELKFVPKFKDVTFDSIDKALASKLLIRYRTLSLVYKQLRELGLVDLPAPSDILSLKPVKHQGEGFTIDGIVTAAFTEAVAERDSSYESAVAILQLYKLSKPIEFSAIQDTTTTEFLYRLPSSGEVRTYREVKLPNEARVYFCSNRYMVLANVGEGRPDEDQNYFVTVLDLGSMFQNYFNGVESYVLFNPMIIARFEKVPFTGKARHVNTKLMLWDTVREPGRYYWFVRGENVKRTNHTFEMVFGTNAQTRYSTLSNKIWSYYCRVFGVIIEDNSVKLRKSA